VAKWLLHLTYLPKISSQIQRAMVADGIARNRLHRHLFLRLPVVALQICTRGLTNDVDGL
jgi:hypothetical protein